MGLSCKREFFCKFSIPGVDVLLSTGLKKKNSQDKSTLARTSLAVGKKKSANGEMGLPSVKTHEVVAAERVGGFLIWFHLISWNL